MAPDFQPPPLRNALPGEPRTTDSDPAAARPDPRPQRRGTGAELPGVRTRSRARTGGRHEHPARGARQPGAAFGNRSQELPQAAARAPALRGADAARQPHRRRGGTRGGETTVPLRRGSTGTVAAPLPARGPGRARHRLRRAHQRTGYGATRQGRLPRHASYRQARTRSELRIGTARTRRCRKDGNQRPRARVARARAVGAGGGQEPRAQPRRQTPGHRRAGARGHGAAR